MITILKEVIMKKILCLVMCVFLVIGLSACGGDISKVKTHDVDSEIYSADDINSAYETIEEVQPVMERIKQMLIEDSATGYILTMYFAGVWTAIIAASPTAPSCFLDKFFFMRIPSPF